MIYDYVVLWIKILRLKAYQNVTENTPSEYAYL